MIKLKLVSALIREGKGEKNMQIALEENWFHCGDRNLKSCFLTSQIYLI